MKWKDTTIKVNDKTLNDIKDVCIQGNNNILKNCEGCKIEGNGNEIHGNNNEIHGNDNLIHTNDSIIRGSKNKIHGNKNKIYGLHNKVHGDNNICQGNNNTMFGSFCICIVGNSFIHEDKLETIAKLQQNITKSMEKLKQEIPVPISFSPCKKEKQEIVDLTEDDSSSNKSSQINKQDE